MVKKIRVNNKQYISLDIEEVYGFHGFKIEIILNAFNQSVFSGYTYRSWDECYSDALECVKYMIEQHMEESKFDMSGLDQELVLKFFEQ